MKTLDVKDLKVIEVLERNDAIRSLSPEEMKRVHGGRAMSVLVDGRPGGVVDDFQLNMAIFEGRIGVKVV
jgi:hypothetical protein